MAEVTLSIGGRTYDVHCGDGEEDHLRRLADMVDAKMAVARQASPGLTEVRQLLFSAILMADENHDLRAERKNEQTSLDLPPVDHGKEEAMIAAHIDNLADRINAIADKLAGKAPTP